MTGSDKAVTGLAAYAIPTIVLGWWMDVWSVLVGMVGGTVITLVLAYKLGRRR